MRQKKGKEPAVTSFFHQKLANGLYVAAERLPFAKSVSIGFFVRCGARYESENISGVSHFLEHMIFKGSPTRSAQDVNREFDTLGISFNACTTEEATIFYATLLPEYLEACMEIYADILRPGFREDDFLAEKEVILEEIGMYENEPPFCMDDRMRQTFFNGYPLGNPVLGSSRSVKRLRLEQLREWLQKMYSPQNITLCACGCVDFDQLLRLAERYCGTWENSPSLVQETEFPQISAACGLPFSPTVGSQSFRRPQAAQQYLLSCSASGVSSMRERLAGRLIASILGDDSGSRLYWEFVDSGRAEHAVLGFTEFSDAGFFSTSLACDPDEALENWKRTEAIYRDAENGGISEEELVLAKNRLATGMILGSEKAWNRLFGIGCEWALAREYRTVEEENALLRSIMLEELHAYLTRFPLTHSLTFSVGPKKQ